jgi:hypothetical protein
MSLAELRPRPSVRLSASAARQNLQTAVDNLNAAMAAQWEAETAEASRKAWDEAQNRKAAAIVSKSAAARQANTRTADKAWLMSMSEGLRRLALDAQSGEPGLHIVPRILEYAEAAERVLRGIVK